MLFLEEQLYHIYNSGNNKETIFFKYRNYDFFLEKIEKHICRFSDLLAFCLMPNHFHILIHTASNSEPYKLNEQIAIMLRSYTRAINQQEKRSGSLFQQKTKAKIVSEYGLVCLNYIHQNPVKAGLTDKIEKWEYSSFREYLRLTEKNICNIDLSKMILGLPDGKDFYTMSYSNIDNELIEKLY